MRDVCRRVRETGVDGVLIGRSAQGAPWLFRNKQAVKQALSSTARDFYWKNRRVFLDERFQIIVEHSEHFNDSVSPRSFVAMRKHLTWYCRNFRGAAEMRAQMTRASNAAEVRRTLADFLTRGEEVHAGSPAVHITQPSRQCFPFQLDRFLHGFDPCFDFAAAPRDFGAARRAFEVIAPEFDETLSADLSIEDEVLQFAAGKGAFGGRGRRKASSSVATR